MNLADALSRLGEQVGVLDGDVYGHSIPHMLGIHQKPIAVDEMIVPPVRGDLKLMSIGFFLDERADHVARADAHRALEQFLSDVHWGEPRHSSSTCRRGRATSRCPSASFCRAPRRSS